jgi:2-polyprenyl-3-methyl-5-hydroxy-6-metoxy-1,4-benzoquinol methylase
LLFTAITAILNAVPYIVHREVPPLEATGERMVPQWAGGFTFWEHVYRYGFACRFVPGKRVLDVACGEGYGSAALERAGAASVVGVDISEEACLHARAKYGIDARSGRAESIPLGSRSVDVVVSFETIQHLPSPARFLEECARVLVRGGRLIVSTPNKEVYSGPGTVPNPYHCSEMTQEEFLSVLQVGFRDLRLYTQHPYSAGWWSPRVLASDILPRIRGACRLRRLAQVALFPRVLREPTEAERSAVVEETLATVRHRSNPLDRYAVRRQRRWTGERPAYFVATALRRG